MKAIICGAGIAGLAAACFLGRAGWHVTVVERAAGLRTAGYMLDFFGSGFDAAEAAGLLPALERRHQSFAGIAYVDAAGRTRSVLDYDLFRASVGGRLLALLRGDVERTLFESLPAGIELRYGTSIATVERTGSPVRVGLDDGAVLDADLLIGADGIHSRVRELVFGPEADYLRFLGYHTAAFVFSDAALSRRLAGRFVILTVPNRQLGLYAIGDTVTAFFAHAAAADRLPDDPAAALHSVYGHLGWHVPEVLAALSDGPDLYYDVVAQVVMPRWVKERTVLIGDAAHAVSLLAGQGASLAVGGSYMLARHLGEQPVDAALAAFEQEVKPAVAEKQAAGRRTADWFVPPSAFHNAVRDVVLNAARLPLLSGMLRRFFAPGTSSIVR